MNYRNYRFILTTAGLAVILAAPIPAQRGGGGGKGGGAGQQGPQGGAGQQGSPGGAKGGQQGQGQRVHVSSQQRDQLKVCDQSADRLQKQARTMADVAKRSGAPMGDLKRAHEQLAQRTRDMDREHQKMMSGLDNEQKGQWAQRIEDMDRDRERMNTRLQQMDQEMAKPDPDRTRIQEQARDMEQAMSHWRKQYEAMQSDATNP